MVCESCFKNFDELLAKGLCNGCYLRKQRVKTPEHVYQTLFTHTKSKAKRRGLDGELTDEDFEPLKQRANGKCEVSGIEFSFDPPSTFRRNPYRPSIDRIDSG